MATTGTRNESRDNGTLGAVRFITCIPVKYLTEPQISIILTDGHGREVKFLGVDGASSRTSSSLYLYKCSDGGAPAYPAYHPIQLAQSLSETVNLANRNGDLAILSWMEGSCAVFQQIFEDYDSNGLGSVSIGGTGQDNGDMIFYDFKSYRGQAISAVASGLWPVESSTSNYDAVTLTISDGTNTIVYEFDSDDTYGETGTLNGSNVIVQLASPNSRLNVVNKLKSAIESSNGHGGKYGTIHTVVSQGTISPVVEVVMDLVHTAAGTTSPSSTTGGGTTGNTLITCSATAKFFGWQPRDDFSWEFADRPSFKGYDETSPDVMDPDYPGFGFSGGINSSKRGHDDLYIKPKTVIEPDFTLHHYDVDHVSSNYNSFEDLRHSLYFSNPAQTTLNMPADNYVSCAVEDKPDLLFSPSLSRRSWSIWFKLSPALRSHSQNHILFSHDSDGDESWTPAVLVWIRTLANTTTAEIIIPYGNFVTYSGTFQNYGDDRWHHAVITLNVGTLTLYVDGLFQKSQEYTGASGNYLGWLTIGAKRQKTGDPTRGFGGSLSDFSHWGATLTASEVVELYNGGKPLDLTTHSAAASLALWWKLASGDAAGSEVDLKDYANGANQSTFFIGTGTNVGATPQLEVNTSGGPDHKLQAPFSKRFQLVRGAGSGRTTIG